MKLTILDSKSILEIQNEFSQFFPYLKIEFFNIPHKTDSGSEKKFLIPNHQTLQECRTKHLQGIIEIIPTMTVTELENSFQGEYGLSVQVFRKSGKVWLETIQTDHWTLAHHNEVGESSMKISNE